MTQPDTNSVYRPNPNDHAIWLFKPKGGYGYVLRVPCKVREIYRTRALIWPAMKDGAYGKEIIVSISNLRPEKKHEN